MALFSKFLKIRRTVLDLKKAFDKIQYSFILDKEPPMVDFCESPPPFITDNEDVNLDWDEPMFHDNSRYYFIFMFYDVSR